ncbi:hypothetical protein [Streptomyces sp. NPDC056105]|uniref:hypothetical protein n=1 Tax=Streptomyces sp. NPDC056105 TaxID=3345714 RepID=UPI0035D552BD
MPRARTAALLYRGRFFSRARASSSGVYFAGGGNYEDDAGLLMPGSYTCANTCTPVPFWAR